MQLTTSRGALWWLIFGTLGESVETSKLTIRQRADTASRIVKALRGAVDARAAQERLQ